MPEACTRCATEVPQEQIERDEAVRFANQLFCPVCTQKLKLVESIVCRHCGNLDLPLFDGVTSVCRNCGADLPHPSSHAGEAAPPPKAAGPSAPAPALPGRLGWAGASLALAAGIAVAWGVFTEVSRNAPPIENTPEFQKIRTTLQGIQAGLQSRLASLERTQDRLAGLDPGRLETDRRETERRLAEAEAERRILEERTRRIGLLEERIAALEARSQTPPPAAWEPAPPSQSAPGKPSPSLEELARQELRALQVRRIPLLQAKSLASALGELDRFPAALSATQAGREVSQLREWERANILRNIYPLEKDRAEALAVKRKYAEAIDAYRDIELHLGIPELIPEIRERLSSIETLMKKPDATRDPVPADDQMRQWLDSFKAAPEASGTLERFVRTGTAAVNVLISGLNHEDRDVRRWAAVALARIRDRRAVEPLLRHAEDPDPWARQVIVRALGDLGDASAVPFLLKLMEADDAVMSRVAHESLIQLSGKTPSVPFDEAGSTRADLLLFWKGWWQEYAAQTEGR